MTTKNECLNFQAINRAFNAVFRPNRLSIGLVAPIENNFTGPVPAMTRHVERIQLAEELGFTAVWLRDVPFNVASFGDAGQIYDPYVYLGLLAGKTSKIGLGVASIVLPLRHPAHVAKAAASVDEISGGRILLGVASGDRPDEYPAMNLPFDDRADRFRASYDYVRRLSENSPSFENKYFGCPNGDMDMIPKPVGGKIPMLITGGSRQDPLWIAKNGDAWMQYPRPIEHQSQIVAEYRENLKKAQEPDKPFMQSLYIDLTDDPDESPKQIHLGFRSGVNYLKQHLKQLEAIGVNHVALSLRFHEGDIEKVMKRLAAEVLPEFSD